MARVSTLEDLEYGKHDIPKLKVEIDVGSLMPFEETVAECVQEAILEELKAQIRAAVRSDVEFIEELKKVVLDHSRKCITIVEGR